jgi:iron complex transport system substrate-binding protein
MRVIFPSWLLAGIVLAACVATPPAPQSAVSTTPEATAPGPIVVQHVGGELHLDQPATRIVACSEEAMDFVLTLGVQPVGICSSRASGVEAGAIYDQPHDFSPAQLGTPVYLGGDDAPALEAIAQLQPDLIITGSWNEASLALLQQIAPTFVLDTAAEGYWRTTLLEVGKALGRTAAAEQFLADYDATVADLQEQLAPLAAETPNVLYWFSYAADYDGVLGPDWVGSKAFALLGFTVITPEGVALEDGFAQVSPEILRDVQADIIFVIRTKLADGTIPHYPVDELLASLNGPQVIYLPIDRTRASTAPLTDKQALEEIAGLLLNHPLAPAETEE